MNEEHTHPAHILYIYSPWHLPDDHGDIESMHSNSIRRAIGIESMSKPTKEMSKKRSEHHINEVLVIGVVGEARDEKHDRQKGTSSVGGPSTLRKVDIFRQLLVALCCYKRSLCSWNVLVTNELSLVCHCN